MSFLVWKMISNCQLKRTLNNRRPIYCKFPVYLESSGTDEVEEVDKCLTTKEKNIFCNSTLFSM